MNFATSPSQKRTIADGNCGPRAVLNQILENKTNLMFKPGQHHELRHWVVQMTQLFVVSGQIDWPYDDYLVENWAEKWKNLVFLLTISCF